MQASRLRRVQATVAAFVLGFIGLGVILARGGPTNSDRTWAEVTARTCASTIARARLAPPTPAQLDPERFLAERQRLLDRHRAFNTVSPFRNVCAAIRDEIRGTTTSTATPSTIDAATEATDRDP